MQKPGISLLLIIAVAACGAAGNTFRLSLSESRIIGGEDTTIEEHPYQISLVYFGSHRCGGAIIHEYWVLTAAHCVYSISTSQSSYLTIRAGSSYRTSGGTIHTISKWIYHSSFSSSNYDYDIALMKVKLPFEFGSTIQPIELPSDDFTLADGTLVAVSGWGYTTQGGTVSSVLQVVEVPVMNNTYCSELYASLNPVTDRMICAAYEAGGKDACQGDSGGPLFYGNILFGLVSWGSGCAQAYQPGVYASVPNLRSWVLENTGVDFDSL